ncbi:hypothetical protein I550_5682 [Mycobacterium intracellulare 1956]|uniref:Uncharacterized protein n=1 Tax=Mycobacterium intracellulare 1956 TaxID=1299331 RepID=X8CD54_MYCIT|nr:hypothetical protein I550_5682 [Mycobacterium intracellulare 1956]
MAAGAIRYRIPSALVPWSALGEPDRSQPAPPDQPVLVQRIDRVLAAGRNEATGRRAQRRHHMPIELDEENQSPRHGPSNGVGQRTHRRASGHGAIPVAGIRRKHRRSSCSNRADDAVRLLGSARITSRSES